MNEHPEFVRADPAQLPRALFLFALVFAGFQIATAGFHLVSSQVLRAMHVGFVLATIFLLYPVRGEGRPRWPWSGLLVAGAALGACWQWMFEAELIQRSGTLTPGDMTVGVITLALLFEATRRVMGWGLPVICAVMLLYAVFGQYLPGSLGHRGYTMEQVVGQLAYGTEGIYGTPTYVSATYIFLFILFGAFLEKAGMIKLFNDIAMGFFGHRIGGPAKVCVASSALMGTISGSGVANVVASGQFTIPLIKRYGYTPAFAGGIEASSSMGGQIMPPVMGAVAFIMAETINVSYSEIVKAALVPAAAYFGSMYWMVHLEAKRRGIVGMKKSDTPNPWEAMRRQWYLMLPLVVLVWLLFAGFTPMLAGTVGLVLTAMLVLGTAIAFQFHGMAMRVEFWVALGLFAAAALKLGNGPVFALVGVLTVVCFMLKAHGRDTLRICANALVEAVRSALPVAAACALVGIMVGVLSLTGIATQFAGFIVDLGQNNLLLSLILTMLVCLVIGMGIPTIPNYIITSSVAAPALLELGVPLIVSHMFVFYFGILADLTPPVALACFAAAPFARESGLKISYEAMRTTMAGYIMPFMAVYTPALMLQSDDLGEIAYIVFKLSIAVLLCGMAAVGHWKMPMGKLERMLMFAAAALLVLALPLTDELGLALSAIMLIQHWVRARRRGAQTSMAAPASAKPDLAASDRADGA